MSKTLVGVATVPDVFDAPVGWPSIASACSTSPMSPSTACCASTRPRASSRACMGSPGTGPLQFQAPMGMAVDSRRQYLRRRARRQSDPEDLVGWQVRVELRSRRATSPVSSTRRSRSRSTARTTWSWRMPGTTASRRFAQKDGEVLADFGSLGQDKAQFNGPTSVGVGPFDNIYVADRGNNRVQIFDGQGKFIGQFGNQGDAPTISPARRRWRSVRQRRTCASPTRTTIASCATRRRAPTRCRLARKAAAPISSSRRAAWRSTRRATCTWRTRVTGG